jgi:hypothetical protein
MNMQSQVMQGRRVNVPQKEITQDKYCYFRAPVPALNVARPDGNRITFFRGWHKTNNVRDIDYLRQLIDEGQIGIQEQVDENAAMEFDSMLNGSAAELDKIRTQIAADPRFAKAIEDMLRLAKTNDGMLESLKEHAAQAATARISTSETAGRAVGGMSNSQAQAAVPGTSISQGDTSEATKVASGDALKALITKNNN